MEDQIKQWHSAVIRWQVIRCYTLAGNRMGNDHCIYCTVRLAPNSRAITKVQLRVPIVSSHVVHLQYMSSETELLTYQ